MPEYKVLLRWTVYGQAIIKAEDPEEAIRKAEDDKFVLPVIDGNIKGSTEVDYVIFEEINGTELNYELEEF
jgi:hypothetical protein